jgi:hypothetical protein
MTQTLRRPPSAEAQHTDQIKVGRFTFTRIETASSAKAWLCSEKNIRILERVPEPGRFWEYVAARGTSDGLKYLTRRDSSIRMFTDPKSAARAAIAEWC